MRPFEILLLLAVAPGLFLRPRGRGPRRIAALVAPAILVLHFALEGARWQMAPAYLLAAFFLWVDGLRGDSGSGSGRRRGPRWARVAGVAAVVGWVAAWALGWALPVFALDPPSGPHAVGSLARQWVDESRADPYAAPERRRLMARIWYPAAPREASRPMPYGGRTPWFLSHWSLIRTFSHADAPVSTVRRRWPVILYNHCYACPVNESTQLLEELASHGFVVVSIAHPYEELLTIFPDGTVVRGDAERIRAVRGQFPLPDYYQRFRAAAPEVQRRMFRALLRDTPLIEESLRLWTADSVFVLERLRDLERSDPLLAGRLDLERIGAAGYSLGGIVAGQLCVERDEISACVNVDCINAGDMLDHPPDKPLLFLASEAFAGANAPLVEQARAAVYSATVAGTTHQNFSDMTLQFPLLRLVRVPRRLAASAGTYGPLVGAIDPPRATEIENAYVTAFFRRHLLGHDEPLLSGPSAEFPEVDLEVRNSVPVRVDPEVATDG